MNRICLLSAADFAPEFGVETIAPSFIKAGVETTAPSFIKAGVQTFTDVVVGVCRLLDRSRNYHPPRKNLNNISYEKLSVSIYQ